MSLRCVWKFVLREPQQVVQMPTGARLLHVADDPVSLNPAVWAEVNEAQPLEDRRLAVVMTGQRFEDDAAIYIGTALIRELGIIAHVYESVAT